MSGRMIPPARPRLSRAEALVRLRSACSADPVVLLGLRGYYRDTMGKPGANDRDVYDDAIALLTPTEFRTFNANTDPSPWQSGVAVLQPGRWLFEIGTHNRTKAVERQYKALIQAAPFRIRRDGAEREEVGWFGINIHRGSRATTSSLGCQTIHPDQWAEFIALAESEMTRHACPKIPYVLVDCTPSPSFPSEPRP